MNKKTNTSIITESESTIFNMQSDKKISSIDLDEDLNSDDIKIFGLYDPEENSLDIDMWSNSDGDQLKTIFKKIEKINLSKDAADIMKISMLTNAHIPRKNISEKDFLEFKKDSKDTRIRHIYLSSKGSKIYNEIFFSQKKRIYKAFLNSSAKEVLNFDQVLKRIINEKL